MHKIIAIAFAVTALAAHGQEKHEHQHAGDHGPVIGVPGDPARVDRTVVIEMRDPFEFSPAAITVRAGETLRIVAVNKGKRLHELVLGTRQYLQEHQETMKAQPGMAHDEPHMVRVEPGKSGTIVWQFTVAGDFAFACLIDDHYESGMAGTLRVQGEAEHAHGGHSHAAPEMRAALGPYPMTREGSGTSWLPDATPQQGIHSTLGDWSTMTHGFANLIYDRQGGPRGASKTFSTSMLMVMGQREAGEGGTLGARGMVSLDPLMGKTGYPLLLQTGESANGQPLLDRQHPHDLFMELALSYSRKLSEASAAFVYAGLPGEPALGPPAFMHRASGEDNPEAPISHHWLDSTHITYGVLTLGYVHGGVKLEASAFRGREPDENRYDIETGKLDSASARLSWNPTREWALQVSYGRLKSPEELHPDVDVDRTTASAIYQTGRTQTTLAWGRNAPRGGGHDHATSAYLLESALRLSEHTFFGRAEYVEKNELFPPDDPRAEEIFRVAKVSLGYVYDIVGERFKVGFGGLVSRYRIPEALKDVYGNPTSFMLFARVRIK
jgi:uncharacterized cupredoxin-like copper-binding protein